MRASGTGSGTGEQLTQTGSNAVTPHGGGSSGSLVATATANAAGLSLGGFAKLTHSSSWSAVRAAEARAAALSGIKAMPEKPLVLLYQLVELMKVLVDQLREKCLEERVESAASRQEKQEAAEGKAAAAAAAAAATAAPAPAGAAATGTAAAGAVAAAAAPGGGGGNEKQGGSAHTLQHSNSTRGTSSSAYSSLTTAPDDWRLDDNKPCSGERLLLMFDRWAGVLVGADVACMGGLASALGRFGSFVQGHCLTLPERQLVACGSSTAQRIAAHNSQHCIIHDCWPSGAREASPAHGEPLPHYTP